MLDGAQVKAIAQGETLAAAPPKAVRHGGRAGPGPGGPAAAIRAGRPARSPRRCPTSLPPAAIVRPSFIVPLAHGQRLVLGPRTLVMGILNVTPDSFAGGVDGPRRGGRPARSGWKRTGRTSSTSEASRRGPAPTPCRRRMSVSAGHPGDRAAQGPAGRADVRRHATRRLSPGRPSVPAPLS
ncbi:MAG: hypothetical protein MZU84_04815 [Sphingobacterium sp.]|nr:hypothetical protein [Sphingobacterium sp.]